MLKPKLTLLLFTYTSLAFPLYLENLEQALVRSLGTTKFFKTMIRVGGKPYTAYYSKDARNQMKRLATVQERKHGDDCQLKWLVSIDVKKVRVQDVRVLEASCPQDLPVSKASFLEQFRGRDPSNLHKIEKEIRTENRPLKSHKLTVDAVKTTVFVTLKLKGVAP